MTMVPGNLHLQYASALNRRLSSCIRMMCHSSRASRTVWSAISSNNLSILKMNSHVHFTECQFYVLLHYSAVFTVPLGILTGVRNSSAKHTIKIIIGLSCG